MNKSLGKKILALLSAAAIPFTTLLSSAPITANAADNYVNFDTKVSAVVSNGKSGSTTIPGRSITKTNGAKLDYTYTGNIFVANSSIYDYRSDNEINGGTIYSEAKGYTDPYTKLNNAISKRVVSASSENLTVTYKSDNSSNTDIRVELYNQSTNQNNGSSGVSMKYDSSRGIYVYTVKYDEIGFVPDKFIINGNNVSWHTNPVYMTLEKGKSYSFYKDNITVGQADNIEDNSCAYNVPLYFGCFYLGDDSSSYNSGNKAKYNNFYWQANLSLRKGNDGKINFDASVQNLVDKELKDGTISQNGVTLPYFSDDWAKAHPDMVKYWHNIAFPFYQINVDASKVHGDSSNTSNDVAKYYQFNSREENLLLRTYEGPDGPTGEYKETNVQIVSQPTTTDAGGTVSYLPFNDHNEYKINNLGFGTAFEMDFRIRHDGKVDTYDKNTGKRTGRSVNATFEFMGDDDVWVFIDGKLILDLGGDHKDTTGIIDFAERKAYANDAIELGAGKGMDDIAGNLSEQKVVSLDNTVMAEGTFNSDGSYNEDKVHTLKMFYMERGMYESDLLVRFNFSDIPDNNKLKIREITRFENINDGLLELTQKAADYDVFNYSISNSGTHADDRAGSGILSPTYNSYVRNNLGHTTVLSGKGLEYDTVDSNDIYLDTSKTLSGGHTWDDNTTLAAWIWKSGDDSSSRLYLAQKIDEHLYKFEGFPSDANKVVFLRLHSDHSYTDGSSSWPGDGNVYDKAELSFEKGYTYVVNDWKNNISKGSKINNQVVHYETHDFEPENGDKVQNVNYIWTDEFASFTGTDKNGLTGTTDDSGFRLMYGTDDKESSAEFKKQFKKGSTMTVNQIDELRTVKGGTTPDDFSTPANRSVKEYYSTTVTVEDSEGGLIIPTTATNETSYAYQNKNTESTSPVQITETFVNKPNVGAITVTKQLSPNDTVTDSFAFTIKLYNVFGVEDMNVTDYSKIKATINGKAAPLSKEGTFTLKRNETLTIQGVPYGTKYTVTETPAKDYEQQSTTANGEQQVYTGTFDNTTTGETKIIPAEANQETVVNTRKTNSLTLSKVLEGDYSSTNINDNTPFDFEVTLSAPTDVDLTKYTFETDPAGIVIEDNYKFTVEVKANQSVEISGIPYGTTYTVKETTVNANWTNDGEKTGEIGEAASTATITNTYAPPPPEPKGSLKVSKNVRGINGLENLSEEMANRGFDFTVTFTNADGEPVSGSFSAERYLNNVKTGDEILTLNEKGQCTFTLKDNENMVILEIPAGTVYAVEEAVDAEYDTTFDGADNGTIEDNVTAEVKFTNEKIFKPYTLPESGFEDTRMYFVLALSGMMLFGLAYFFINRKKLALNS